MKKLLILPLLTLGITACVEDEGNYSYTDLNEINVENIEDTYSVLSMVDHLQISPELSNTYGHDLSNFKFKWQLCDGAISDPHEHRVIGEEKDIDWLVDLAPGSYYLYYFVTDLNTGIENQYEIKIRVAHPLTRGFLILGQLCEENRVALDMLSMPEKMDTIMVEETFDNSQLNLRDPQKLIYSGYYPTGSGAAAQTLYIMADDKSYRLNSGASFDIIGEFNDLGLFDTDYTIERPAKMRDLFPHQGANRCMSSSNRGYMTDDMVMFGSIMQGEYFVTPVNRYSTADTKLYKPFQHVFCNTSSTYTSLIFYDLDNQRFGHYYPLGNTGPVSTPLTDRDTDPWKWEAGSEGRTIVYGENGYGVNRCYALMKNDSDEYFIYTFMMQNSATATTYNKQIFNIDKSVAVDFDKARFYMFAHNRSSIFYVIGSRLYHYDYGRGYIDFHDFGDEITYLEHDYCSNARAAEYFVATYSDTHKGKIYKMEVTTSVDNVEFKFLPNQEWNTRLKVKDMEWKYGV